MRHAIQRTSILRSMLLAGTVLGAVAAPAAHAAPDDVAEIVVIGRRSDLSRIPGSAAALDAETLRLAQPYSINEALRKVPGIMPREEEGFGLRPNIGIRGLNPTRSSKTLLLEDGIPLSFAPYGDNATYYHPATERYQRIEILKGSGQIAFGPQTVGGVINYVTANPPEELAGAVTLRAGNRGFREAIGTIGGTFGGTGVAVDAVHKEADGSRDNMDFQVQDVAAKLVQRIDDRQSVAVKLSHYREDSRITYSGLTLAEYTADPRQNPFVNDGFDAERTGASITHRLSLTDAVELTTALYGSWFDRDWWRQSSNSGQRPNDASDPACGGMANLNSTCGNEGRLRSYSVWGVEPRLTARFATGAVSHDLTAGLRAHYEDQDRRQVNGDTPRARTAGTSRNAGLVEDNERQVEAWSGFVQDQLGFGAFSLTPGVRFESIQFERTNRLGGASGESDLTEWIPGLGATWQAAPGTTLFAGVHRGFAPPRVEDVVTNAGGSVDLGAERSWSYELGLRSAPSAGVRVEAALFRMDFENQIVPASVAGGTGAALTSAGETLHQGLEAALRLDSRELFGTGAHNVYLDGAWTWLWDAKYEGDRFSAVSGFSTVRVTGNRLPYAPEHLLAVTLGYAHDAGFAIQAEGVFTGAMYTDDLNTGAVTANGQRGRIDPHWVFNLAASYALPDTGVTLYATAKNVFDRLYVVDRSRGIVPGNPRLIQAGARWAF